ncbi:MAG: hypothetical protein JXA82_12595 [Sedimentisphaerales bacterium]|nr:hypothetical protein [Sedimentisphaerales bacterium]
MAKKKDILVPYDQVSPGFEAVYTGETSSKSVQENEMISTLHSDADGNLIRRWCTIPWIFPDKEAGWKEDQWDDTIKHLRDMQANLGPLSDSIRQLRAHITGLIPCDSGLPVTVDEILFAIARGKLERSSFKNGCLCSGIGCRLKTSQPRQAESIRTIHAIMNAYLEGEPREDAIKAHPEATGFIKRSYEWLGAVSQLSKVQRKMLDRMLLLIDFFTKTGYTGTAPQSLSEEMSGLQEMEALGKDLFYDENGRGPHLDTEIAELAGLPKIVPQWNPEFKKTFDKLEASDKKELYNVCGAIAAGVQTLSDCHHNTFRYIEGWIHGIGTGRLGIPTRKAQSEKQRLGRMLFGYALGLDRWLMRIPMQFLLLDLGHVDLGFDPRNNILRVYACLGEERTPVKEWLAACLWYNLVHNQQGGLIGSWTSSHTDLILQCKSKGIAVDEWMNSALRNGS